jgi:hypothetical protein
MKCKLKTYYPPPLVDIRSSDALLPEKRVDTPGPGTREHKVQVYETVDHRQLTSVYEWQKTARRMCHKIRGGHKSARQECNGARKQADKYQQAAEKFDNARYQHKRAEFAGLSGCGITKKLLAAVPQQQESRNNA